MELKYILGLGYIKYSYSTVIRSSHFTLPAGCKRPHPTLILRQSSLRNSLTSRRNQGLCQRLGVLHSAKCLISPENYHSLGDSRARRRSRQRPAEVVIQLLLEYFGCVIGTSGCL